MQAVDFYHKLYDTIGAATPLGFDCGRLCSSACCLVTDDLPGMWLFPGEEALYATESGFKVTQYDLPGYGKVSLLSCQGRCNRETRPLACRVFPLAPMVFENTVSLRLDPRGRPVCPLCHEKPGALSPAFRSSVGEVFRMLLAEPATAGFLTALSQALDEYEKPFL